MAQCIAPAWSAGLATGPCAHQAAYHICITSFTARERPHLLLHLIHAADAISMAAALTLSCSAAGRFPAPALSPAARGRGAMAFSALRPPHRPPPAPCGFSAAAALLGLAALPHGCSAHGPPPVRCGTAWVSRLSLTAALPSAAAMASASKPWGLRLTDGAAAFAGVMDCSHASRPRLASVGSCVRQSISPCAG